MSVSTTHEVGFAARREPSAAPVDGERKKRYAIKAIWRTLQGEGAWSGRAAVFVRLAGCNMWTGEARDRARDAARNGAACPLWCDTDFRKAGAVRLTASDLVAEIQRVAAEANPEVPIRFVVLTGGEPFLQADAVLVQALHAEGFEIAVETNGTVALAEAFTDAEGALALPDWVVCSPKLPEDRLVLEWMDELKLVVPDYRPEAYARFAERTRPHEVAGRTRRHLWLQPEDGPRQEKATRLAIALALRQPDWRVSVQTHKLLGID
ncbi:MAG: radical SAM protein [Rhodothermaceae bacterium]|nr:radical SAM protein [Rhodothermaceae bacterium]